MTKKYILYGSPASLYTGKVRAYLNYKRLPYTETLSSLWVYKKVIIPKTGVRFIPVVKTPQGEYIQDSTNIIDTLEIKHPERSVYPNGAKQHLTALLFELYGDEWLRIPAMHYRWNFPDDNLEFIIHEFGSSVLPKTPKFVQKWMGQKIVNKFSAYVVPLGINETTIPAIESWYENLLSLLNEHFKQHNFLLGSCPSIGDYGLMGPLYAHLYRDPYPGKLMKKIAPEVAKWVERMNDGATVEGEFLGEDEVPETLTPILTHMFKEYWPVLETVVDKVSTWLVSNPSCDEIPRVMGMHPFTLGNTSSEQMTLPYTQWMLQRVLDYYQQIIPEDKLTVDVFLNHLQAGDAMNIKLINRVVRKNNLLTPA